MPINQDDADSGRLCTTIVYVIAQDDFSAFIVCENLKSRKSLYSEWIPFKSLLVMKAISRNWSLHPAHASTTSAPPQTRT
jgi:hypothetical protein